MLTGQPVEQPAHGLEQPGPFHARITEWGRLHRRPVEACLSWLLNNRRLVRRYDRKAEHFQAFADLGSVLLCYRRWVKATN